MGPVSNVAHVTGYAEPGQPRTAGLHIWTDYSGILFCWPGYFMSVWSNRRGDSCDRRPRPGEYKIRPYERNGLVERIGHGGRLERGALQPVNDLMAELLIELLLRQPVPFAQRGIVDHDDDPFASGGTRGCPSAARHQTHHDDNNSPHAIWHKQRRANFLGETSGLEGLSRVLKKSTMLF